MVLDIFFIFFFSSAGVFCFYIILKQEKDCDTQPPKPSAETVLEAKNFVRKTYNALKCPGCGNSVYELCYGMCEDCWEEDF